MKKPLILIPSPRMDSNQKSDRGEDKLIRIGSKARTNLNLDGEKTVELWPNNTTSDRINRSKVLSIFQGFSSDLKAARGNGMSQEEYLRVGFVTTRTFEYICGNGANSKNDIWISQSIDDTVVGGDPEFILIDEGNTVQYAGMVGGFGSEGELGSDGPLAEIRPAPAIEVEDFVNTISKILKTHPKAKYIKNYKWMADCCWLGRSNNAGGRDRDAWPIGGHIHIGTPAQIANKLNINNLFKHFYYVTLTRILDELLAIPIMRVDNKEGSKARRTYYGMYGDYRTEHNRLEYRTLSGMWMAHPKLALITIGVAKAIIDTYFQMLEAKNFRTEYISGTVSSNTNCFDPKFDSWSNMGIMLDFGTTLSSAEMKNILHNYAIKYDKAYIKSLSERLRKLPTYDKYATYIDQLIELVAQPYNKINKMSRDLKKAWVDGEDFII